MMCRIQMHNKFPYNVYNMITGLSQVHCCHCCELLLAACCLPSPLPVAVFLSLQSKSSLHFPASAFPLCTKGNFSATMSVDFHFTMQQQGLLLLLLRCCTSCSCWCSCCCCCRWLCALSLPLLSVMLLLLCSLQRLIQCKCVKACPACRKQNNILNWNK